MFRPFTLATCGLLCVACAPTLTRSPQGWHDVHKEYFITPSSEGKLLAPGWLLVNQEEYEGGYRETLDPEHPDRDLEYHRADDDGVLMVATEDVPDGAEGKLPSVLAERWLHRVVSKPSRDSDYQDLVPPVTSSARVSGFGGGGPFGIWGGQIEATHGYAIEVVQHEDFEVPGGVATSFELNLIPAGSAVPDRKMLLALLRRKSSHHMVVVAYANTPTMFENGAKDAQNFVHRIHF